MKHMLTVQVPTIAGNREMADASFASKMGAILTSIQAEATWITVANGNRTAVIIVNLSDASKFATVTEPFFRWLEAEVSLVPVITPQELLAGMAA